MKSKHVKWRKLLIMFLFNSLIGNVITIFLSGFDYLSDIKIVVHVSLYSLLMGTFLWKGNEYITIYLAKKYHWLEQPAKRTIYSILSIGIFSFFAIVSFNFIWNLIFLHNDFWLSMRQNMYSFFLTFVISFVVSIAVNAVIFFRNWRNAVRNEEELKRERLVLQYEALKNQVNPHFLFNSLNVLTSLVYRDPDISARFIRQLADVYRYVLDQKDVELTPLSLELRFVESYIYLQKIRFEEGLITEIVNCTDNEGYIIPLSLQMLVENAIKHNIVSREEPLTIRIEIVDNYVIVTNNLQRKTVSADSTSIGLANIKARYEYLSNKDFEVIETKEIFKVKVPLLKALSK